MTYSYDAAVLETQMPAAVVRPLSSQAMGEVVAFCNAHQLPLIVRGSGTNLSGGTIPLAEGVVLLTNGLNRILEINTEDMYAIVQPGVITARLAAAVEAKDFSTRPIPAARRCPPWAAMWLKMPAACAALNTG